MPAHIVATVRVTDADKFGAYTKAIAGLAEQHGGEYVIRGKITQVLEGDIDPDERVVIIRFPTSEAALAYANSAEYKAGARLREGAGTVDMRLIADA